MTTPSALVVPTLLSVVAWFLECLALWVILRGFGENDIRFWSACFFYATATLAGALIPVPGGLGVTEKTLEEQLIGFGGVGKFTATSAMILVRFATLWFAVLVGFVALALHARALPGAHARRQRPVPAAPEVRHMKSAGGSRRSGASARSTGWTKPSTARAGPVARALGELAQPGSRGALAVERIAQNRRLAAFARGARGSGASARSRAGTRPAWRSRSEASR